jgi:hypothetical protein
MGFQDYEIGHGGAYLGGAAREAAGARDNHTIGNSGGRRFVCMFGFGACNEYRR